jgi:hypothetical protein
MGLQHLSRQLSVKLQIPNVRAVLIGVPRLVSLWCWDVGPWSLFLREIPA